MNEAKLDGWKAVLTGESLLYGLLSKALYEELDKDWLDLLIGEEVFAESPFGGEQGEVQRWTGVASAVDGGKSAWNFGRRIQWLETGPVALIYRP